MKINRFITKLAIYPGVSIDFIINIISINTKEKSFL